jgi:hypothetical protein
MWPGAHGEIVLRAAAAALPAACYPGNSACTCAMRHLLAFDPSRMVGRDATETKEMSHV